MLEDEGVSKRNIEFEREQELVSARRRLIFAAIPAAILFYLAMAHMITFIRLPYPPALEPHSYPLRYVCVQIILTLPVLICGRSFYINGFPALFRLTPNMDSLIASGTSAAVIYSLWSALEVFRGNKTAVMDLYFESAAMIITLVMLGKYLEQNAKRRTGKAIEALYSLSPLTALVERGGKAQEIPVEKLEVGDIMVILPGSKIPADGTVLEGVTTADESMLTGESMPVDKKTGDTVTGATINGNGAIKVRVERVGGDSALAQIIRLVEEAQGSKVPIARLADVVSGYFVPASMVIALAAFICWLIAGESFSFALRIFISVLVIACPCALGLATPTAIMVGTGRGASKGILFRNGQALESLKDISIIILDKTGTLTNGQPNVTDILPADGISCEDLLSLAASAEQFSEHPLGKAIKEKADEEHVAVFEAEGHETFPGLGISALVKEKRISGGNPSMMERLGIDLAAFGGEASELAEKGRTPMYFAMDSIPIGVIAIADTLKNDAALTVTELSEMGLKTVMLTGDNKTTARAIAEQAGIENVVSEVLPNQKAGVIKEYINSGEKVAMVGDGINDAPALSSADIGIAVGGGSDVAIESADVIIMGRSLSGLTLAVKLSRTVIRNIKQNLFWAFCYNTVGIPIAAGLLYAFGGPLLNPVFAAAAMSLSSISVVSNALRLNFINLK